MKIRNFLAMAVIAASATIGCSSDSDSKDTNVPNPPATTDAIVGNWRSIDASLLLTSLGIDSIHADFRANQTYKVTSFTGGAGTELSGTYTTTEGVNGIRNILLNQNVPSTITSQGIYKVENGQLRYEVAQVEPVLAGVTAPTAEAGFGSTSAGAYGNMNIQVYVARN